MPAKLVKRIGYSAYVREKFDARRPRYTEAVKAIAAFTHDARMFGVLVAHLNAACAEARTLPRAVRLIALK